MPTPKEEQWLARFGELMVHAQRFEERLAELLFVKDEFSTPEAALAALRTNLGNTIDASLRRLDDTHLPEFERSVFDAAKQVRNLLAHNYFRLWRFEEERADEMIDELRLLGLVLGLGERAARYLRDNPRISEQTTEILKDAGASFAAEKEGVHRRVVEVGRAVEEMFSEHLGKVTR